MVTTETLLVRETKRRTWAPFWRIAPPPGDESHLIHLLSGTEMSRDLSRPFILVLAHNKSAANWVSGYLSLSEKCLTAGRATLPDLAAILAVASDDHGPCLQELMM